MPKLFAQEYRELKLWGASLTLNCGRYTRVVHLAVGYWTAKNLCHFVWARQSIVVVFARSTLLAAIHTQFTHTHTHTQQLQCRLFFFISMNWNATMASRQWTRLFVKTLLCIGLLFEEKKMSDWTSLSPCLSLSHSISLLKYRISVKWREAFEKLDRTADLERKVAKVNLD